MIPLAELFRGGFLIIILLWYSVTVWQAMDGYFRDEFKKYLEKEFQQNKHLKADMTTKTDSSEAQTVRSIHSNTVKGGTGNTATSSTKTGYDDTIKENYNKVKQNIQDISTSTTPKLETRSPFISTDTKPHTSTVQHIQSHLKEKETHCTVTTEAHSNENRCH
jgi:hypothetical protein